MKKMERWPGFWELNVADPKIADLLHAHALREDAKRRVRMTRIHNVQFLLLVVIAVMTLW